MAVLAEPARWLACVCATVKRCSLCHAESVPHLDLSERHPLTFYVLHAFCMPAGTHSLIHSLTHSLMQVQQSSVSAILHHISQARAEHTVAHIRSGSAGPQPRPRLTSAAIAAAAAAADQPAKRSPVQLASGQVLYIPSSQAAAAQHSPAASRAPSEPKFTDAEGPTAFHTTPVLRRAPTSYSRPSKQRVYAAAVNTAVPAAGADAAASSPQVGHCR